MRTQKRLLIVSFYAALFAFASAALFAFVLNAWDGQGFWKDLSFAVLGSAAMGVLLSLTEYMVMRRTTLEEYYLAASDCLRAFSKAAFFYVRGPKGLLSDYYSENFPISPKVSHPAKDALRKYIADEYLTFLDSSVHIPGSELSKLIEEKLHQAIQEYKRFVEEKAAHFRFFLQAEHDNAAMMMAMVEEIQSRCFRIEERTEEEMAYTTVYRSFKDGLEDELARLLCRIYRQQYKPEEHSPFCEYSHGTPERNSARLPKKQEGGRFFWVCLWL